MKNVNVNLNRTACCWNIYMGENWLLNVVGKEIWMCHEQGWEKNLQQQYSNVKGFKGMAPNIITV